MSRLTLERTAPNVATVTRRFAARPDLVFRAHIEPDLIRQWCYGPEGWQMTRCDMDPTPGGGFRYDWKEAATGAGFHITGEFILIEAPYRIVHVERMFLPDRTPDNQVETLLDAEGSGTRLTMTMTMPDADALDAMLATGMADGMEMSYARIDTLIA